jgi:stress response protein SCP2
MSTSVLSKGSNINLSNVNPGLKNVSIVLDLGTEATDKTKLEFDVSVFMLQEKGKVGNDDSFIFYNQRTSVCGSVNLALDNRKIDISLDKIPLNVVKIVVATTISSSQNFGKVDKVSMSIDTLDGNKIALFNLPADAERTEKAMILGEIYRHNGDWKFKAIGQGFNGGLGPLATTYGVDVGEDPTPAPVIEKVSLVKKMEDKAPHLVNLAKKAEASLNKNGLLKVKAKVANVLDASGSMLGWSGDGQYGKGDVQKVIDLLTPVAAQFDDDGSFESWAYSDKPLPLPAVTLNNCKDYIITALGGYKQWRKQGMFSGNNEVAVIRAIIDYYKGTTLPVYILFVTDGGIGNKDEIKKLMIEASSLPIFWQFAGIGGSSYGPLKELDKMTGRLVDNAGFFELDSIGSKTVDEIYDLLLSEFPVWLKVAKEKGILPA